jgi:hypothetical protein
MAADSSETFGAHLINSKTQNIVILKLIVMKIAYLTLSYAPFTCLVEQNLQYAVQMTVLCCKNYALLRN